ncbi:MAG: LysM peptidoglycan-binding domain-containing protein [Gammaproteobacteria bacterium]|nr:LysM peptidoglycan-binding domain-containing protein [Gammaproteobacteria bacterium]
MHTRILHFISFPLLTTVLAACQLETVKPEDTSTNVNADSVPTTTIPGTEASASTDSDTLDYDAAFNALITASEPHETVWQHVRAGFKFNSDYDQELIQAELAWYSSNEGYMNRVMERSEPFLHYILSEAEKLGLPTELVLLPIVESAFQPFAYSHGRAAGLWQFIPATGRSFGLRQDWWYDGRRDIHASTQAALQYLSNLSKMFDGDWLLALAAYNSGQGTVRRAIRKNERLNKPTDFWNLDLPRETRSYVPKMLALKEIINNPQDYGVSLRCIPHVPGFKLVDVGSQIDLALAAEMANIDLDTLYNYNPAFNRWSTPPEGPHMLLLPADAADTLITNLEILPEKERVSWKRHLIKSGDTLGQIAHNYDTTVKHLRKVNRIKGNNIRAGKYLLIPVASRNLSEYTLSADQRLSSKKTSGSGTRIKHVVARGDSFWKISRKYDVSMKEIAKWNGMGLRDPLREGQSIVIWTGSAPTQALSARGSSANTKKSISYTVRNGDSLSYIAQRYNVSVNDLHRWNDIKGKYIQPGQRIKVHIDITEQNNGRG